MPIFDPVEYLVSRRYPFWKIAMPGANNAHREKAVAYEKELRTKAPEEINHLVKVEKAAEAEERRRKLEAEESARYFNQPSATADFSHWGKLSYWTLDEAVALSFGRAPETVNWKGVEGYVSVSPFAFQYKRRRELAKRAQASSELYDPVRPNFFIAWAKRLDWQISAELEDIALTRGQDLGDWKTAFENEKVAHSKTMEWAKSQISDAIEFAKQKQAEALEVGREAVAERDAEIEQLREALSAIEKQKAVESRSAKSPSPEMGARERESMLRLIIGMAIKGHTYRPDAAKNAAVKEISGDLYSLGIGLDKDTVRKYLQAGKELLPRPETEQHR